MSSDDTRGPAVTWLIGVLAAAGLVLLVVLIRNHLVNEREARRLRREGILDAAVRLGFRGTAEGTYLRRRRR
jgi:hypothetical protein